MPIRIDSPSSQLSSKGIIIRFALCFSLSLKSGMSSVRSRQVHRLVASLVVTLFPFSLLSAAGDDASSTELIRDPHFRAGFILLDPKPGALVPYGQLPGLDSGAKPVWQLAQWASKYPLTPESRIQTDSLALSYSNPGKTVSLGPQNSSDADASLSVTASKEYGQRARRDGENWVHLLAQQDLTNLIPLDRLQSLTFRIDVKLINIRRVSSPEYSPTLHAAQFLIYFIVQNRNQQSKGFGKYLWFGIPVFDDRQRFSEGTKAEDQGKEDATGQFIYSPSFRVFSNTSVQDREWVCINQDLLPLMLEGLHAAWSHGFLQDSKELSDYCISGMNIGWEVPGIFDVTMQFKDLSLQAALKNSP